MFSIPKGPNHQKDRRFAFFSPLPLPPSPKATTHREICVDEWSSHTKWVADSLWDQGNQFICSACAICLDKSWYLPDPWALWKSHRAELALEPQLKSKWICGLQSTTLTAISEGYPITCQYGSIIRLYNFHLELLKISGVDEKMALVFCLLKHNKIGTFQKSKS